MSITIPGSFAPGATIVRDGRTYRAVASSNNGTIFEEVGNGGSSGPGVVGSPQYYAYFENAKRQQEQAALFSTEQVTPKQKEAGIIGFEGSKPILSRVAQERGYSPVNPQGLSTEPKGVIAAAVLAQRAAFSDPTPNTPDLIVQNFSENGVNYARLESGTVRRVSYATKESLGGQASVVDPFDISLFFGTGLAKAGAVGAGALFLGAAERQVAKRAIQTGEKVVAKEATQGLFDFSSKSIYESNFSFGGKIAKEALGKTPMAVRSFGVGFGLYGAGTQAPEAATQASLFLSGRQPGINQVDSIIVAKFGESPEIQNAFQLGVESEQKKRTEQAKKGTAEGLIAGGQDFFFGRFRPANFVLGQGGEQVARGEIQKVLKEKTSYNETQRKTIENALVARAGYGGAIGLALTDVGSEVAAGPVVARIFKGPKAGATFAGRVGRAAVAVAPFGVAEGLLGTYVGSEAEYRKATNEQYLFAGLLGGASSGTLSGLGAGFAPSRGLSKGIDVVGQGIDAPTETFGNVAGARINRLIGVESPTVNVRSSSAVGVFQSAFAPVENRVKGKLVANTLANALIGTPVGTPVSENIAANVPVGVPSGRTVTVQPPGFVGVPESPIETPVGKTPVNEPVDLPVDVSVGSNLSVDVPVGIYTAGNFPLLPFIGFGGGQESGKKTERKYYYDELSRALNNTFGVGFVKTLEKRGVPVQKKKRGKRVKVVPFRVGR